MPAAARMPPPLSRGYPARRRTGQATLPSETAVAVPEPDTVPSRKPASVTVRPGAARRPPERGERDVDEELARARVLEHRAVDREQHDVGRGDVERHPEQPLGAHVEVGDDAVDVVARGARATSRPAGSRRSRRRRGSRGRSRAGSRPRSRRVASSTSSRQPSAHRHVEHRGLDGAPDEVVEAHQRVGAHHEGEPGEDPVEHRPGCRAPSPAGGGSVGRRPGARRYGGGGAGGAVPGRGSRGR